MGRKPAVLSIVSQKCPLKFLSTAIGDQIERLKWSLWHGQVDRALDKIDDLERAIAPFSETYARYAGQTSPKSPLHIWIAQAGYAVRTISKSRNCCRAKDE